MAMGILAAPGTKVGPCKTKCGHIDCRQTRADAAAQCRFCGKAIGYGVGFIRARLTGALAHDDCAHEAMERNDARLGEF
jgi:hypothetical protein